ncbi:MAG: hypothetical protein JF616_08405 [Fibrobacteres bacterium]|jgi:hypothetical protein|nr:hypothetical protein [Fibrobacterota bacterium]
MTVLSMLAALSIGAAAGRTGPSAGFLRYWKSGLAEIASYTVDVERYGEMRKGQAVLVYVYEEMDARTRIKAESDRIPRELRVPVLKLNHVLKFNTGIYDYSILTSVFAGLSGPGVNRFLQPRKVSFTSQEWCGNVFHQLIPGPRGLRSEIHSYFEAEGDSIATLAYPPGGDSALYYEDEMPILVRELDGPVQANGTSRKIHLVPGLWERRKRHVPLAIAEAVLAKSGPEPFLAQGETVPAMRWTLEAQGVTTTWHVEEASPHTLLGWENSRGEKGVLIASLRDTYWEHNHNANAGLRKRLGLDFGVGD